MKTKEDLEAALAFVGKDYSTLQRERQAAYSQINRQSEGFERELWDRLRDTVDAYYNERAKILEKKIEFIRWALEAN
jgi:hypothetical protein